MTVLSWLLESDPSIRWQVMRDLMDEPDQVVRAERERVSAEGWGDQLLSQQTPEGYWGGQEERRNWLTTIYTLSLLRDFGPNPSSSRVQQALSSIRQQVTWWQLDGRPFFDGETEPCVNGMILSAGAYFGEATERLADRLVDEQLPDGGWNCSAPKSQRGSFNTTICVLEGLVEHERVRGPSPAITQARLRAQEYLLERRMFRSRTTGQVIEPGWVRYSFPTTWHYDVLRGLDCLRYAEVKPDARVTEAVDRVLQRRDAEGRWPLNVAHADRLPLDMEAGIGEPSRWNTLRAMRVLKWYDSKTA